MLASVFATNCLRNIRIRPRISVIYKELKNRKNMFKKLNYENNLKCMIVYLFFIVPLLVDNYDKLYL